MEHIKKTYETTFIINAGLDDAQIDSVIEKTKDVITKNGGEIRDLAKLGRKRFAFPVRKKNNGFYVVFEFFAPGDTIAKLERHFQLDENVIRFITILLDKNALKSRIAPSELAKQASTEPQVSTPPAVKKEAPVVRGDDKATPVSS